MSKSESRSGRTFSETTQPRPVDAGGFVLDEWGLPLSGPRRRAALAETGRRDPREHPEDWETEARAARVKKAKESILGPEKKEEGNG